MGSYEIMRMLGNRLAKSPQVDAVGLIHRYSEDRPDEIGNGHEFIMRDKDGRKWIIRAIRTDLG